MRTSQARIATDRPNRYLVQVCKHASDMDGRGGHAMLARRHDGQEDRAEILHAEWTDSSGVIQTSWGQCSLRAAPGMLTLRAEAADEDNLLRIQDLLSARLERFGRRDRLQVAWEPDSQPDPGGSTETPAEPQDELAPARPRWKTVMLIVIVVLLIALFVILHVTGVVGAKTM